MIRIEVNGKQREFSAPVFVGHLLDLLGINPKVVAVELNGEIIDRGEYDAVVVGDQARVEIVRMIGGGSSLL